jgi:hypothetical protein
MQSVPLPGSVVSPPNVLSLSCGEAPCAAGRAARRLPQLTRCRWAASASGVHSTFTAREECCSAGRFVWVTRRVSLLSSFDAAG